MRGGKYSIGCAANGFTKDNGTIAPGQTVCVQSRSSSSYSAATNTTLTIGGVSDKFTVITIAGPPQ